MQSTLVSHLFKSSALGFGIEPFYIPTGPLPSSTFVYALHAPTTSLNAQRILRAMQLRKPILLVVNVHF